MDSLAYLSAAVNVCAIFSVICAIVRRDVWAFTHTAGGFDNWITNTAARQSVCSAADVRVYYFLSVAVFIIYCCCGITVVSYVMWVFTSDILLTLCAKAKHLFIFLYTTNKDVWQELTT